MTTTLTELFTKMSISVMNDYATRHCVLLGQCIILHGSFALLKPQRHFLAFIFRYNLLGWNIRYSRTNKLVHIILQILFVFLYERVIWGGGEKVGSCISVTPDRLFVLKIIVQTN